MNLQIFFLLYFSYLITGKELLHHFMHDHEIESVFHRKREAMDEIDYHVVHINQQFKRSIPTLRLNAFNEDYTFHLEKNEVLLGDGVPILHAHCDAFGKNIKYSAYKYEFPVDMEAYHDRKKRASFITYKDDDGKMKIEGKIGQNILVKQLPNRVQTDILKGSMQNLHHVVIKTVKETDSRSNLTNDFNNTNNAISTSVTEKKACSTNLNNHHAFRNNLKKKTVRKLRSLSGKSWDNFGNEIYDPTITSSKSSGENDVVYIETLVAVDYDTFGIHKNDFKSLALYMAAFWNAVDLKYRDFTNPEIRINIAGLIVPQSPKCEPYIEDNFVEPNRIKVSKALDDISIYYKNNPLKNKINPAYVKVNYDLVAVMTNRDLKNEKSNDVLYLGLATGVTVCTDSDQWSASAIINDNGGFSGVLTAAHEIAHLLGAPHDDEKYIDPETNTEKPSCPAVDQRYLMFSQGGGFYWSPCSISILKNEMSQHSKNCLRNKPSVGNSYIQVLPNSRNQQCQRKLNNKGINYNGTDVNRPSQSYDCLQLWCFYYEDGQLFEGDGGIPAEGSDCGEEKICINGKCVRNSYKFRKYF